MTHVGREQEVPALPPRPARTPAAALAVRAGLVALAAAVLFFCYWRQSQAVPLSSDGSSKDRKSTRLNSSHGYISYAVFCLKKKKKKKVYLAIIDFFVEALISIRTR